MIFFVILWSSYIFLYILIYSFIIFNIFYSSIFHTIGAADATLVKVLNVSSETTGKEDEHAVNTGYVVSHVCYVLLLFTAEWCRALPMTQDHTHSYVGV